nr:immunoglobulin light chain junction region [Macaca mulatta]MOX99521.1 immunoglobulin light chain junction region [Macaca mulatta]MOY00609.1 immunoglobulin light chain junction region [Macaca mulatta]MOY00679.1 immunoglobulin light chain junction region [Macaca mulatta]MOY02339.1 immunoglobulin light chain junction region [Macaca mulatta]
CLQSKKSPYSF